MRIVVEQGETVYYDQDMTRGTFYVGRHEQCQIKLSGSESIAPRHLMIYEENGRWFVAPLHSSFQTTKFNGQQLLGKHELTDGCELLVGEFHIRCRMDEMAAKTEAVPFQVLAKSLEDLQKADNLLNQDLNLPDSVIVKNRKETFSLSKGHHEYILTMALKMAEMPDVRSLLSLMVEVLLADFQAGCVWIGLRTDEEGHLTLSAGRNLSGQLIDAPPTAQQFSFAVAECGRALLQQSVEDDPERTCICSPLISPDGALGMVYLESNPQKIRYNTADLDTLVFIGGQLAMAIDRLLRKEKQDLQEMRTLDQELARKVQAHMASWKLPQWPDLQLTVLSEPGSGSCTDFYDVLPLGEKQGMILVGQTASGTPDAAICIAQMVSAFRIGAVHRDELQVLMRQVNWLMHTTSTGPRRISAGILSIDPVTGDYFYCAAGDIHAYLLGTTGKVVKVQNVPNPLIGESRKSKYEAVKGKLASEQTMVIGTSGIFSVVSGRGDPFDEPHLWDLLADSGGQSPARIVTELAEDIASFTGGKKAGSDITLLVIRKGKASAVSFIGLQNPSE